MNLQKILDYQKVDIEIYKLEMSLRNSEAGKNLAQATKVKGATTEDVMKCVRNAEEVVVLVERYRQTYDKIASEMAGLSDVLDTFEEAREIDIYEKKIDQYKKELLSIERELTKLSKRLDECAKKSEEDIVLIKKCNKLMAESKAKIEEMKSKMMDDVKALMIQLNALKKDIPPEVIKKYEDVKKNGKMPVLVQANDGGKSCGGCGMDLSSKETNSLNSGALVDCPNCGRIVYMK